MQVTFVTILRNTVVVKGPVLRKLKHSRSIARREKKKKEKKVTNLGHVRLLLCVAEFMCRQDSGLDGANYFQVLEITLGAIARS
jgi:hypothetical protein